MFCLYSAALCVLKVSVLTQERLPWGITVKAFKYFNAIDLFVMPATIHQD